MLWPQNPPMLKRFLFTGFFCISQKSRLNFYSGGFFYSLEEIYFFTTFSV